MSDTDNEDVFLNDTWRAVLPRPQQRELDDAGLTRL
jgi:hypothetical protein